MSSTILITGSSSGIGRATAEHFAKAGWNVAATMRKPDEAGAWIDEPRISAFALDVTRPESIRAALAAAIEKFGAIDAVVNNAGYGLVGPFEASTPQQVDRQIATNVIGVMNVIREIIPHFRQRQGGTIINVTSMGGRVTFPLYSVYHASKWAVEGFCESLVYELAPLGIRVKIVEPGPIKTDFYGRSMDVITRPGLNAYDEFVAKAMPAMQQAGATAPGPEVVAKTIYKAATDTSARLRYPVNSHAILWARHLLGTRAFMAIVRGQVLK
jgi:NAD(P)-dependent dehydrogenase (short-subunit alcohol dehydrogenase family)